MTSALVSAALFVVLWLAIPLVVAPIAVVMALLPNGNRRPRRQAARVTVHDLGASHPTDHTVRVVCH